MKLYRRFCALLAAALLAGAAALPALAAQPSGEQVTVLFTHDMHSHFLPVGDGQGGTYGGFARLKTAIDQQKALHPDALLLDGGDFSMGSLFQTAYSTSALELRLMGRMGYDVTTFGNHEYDYRASGLADMLQAALASGDPLPAIVEANYLPPREGEEGYGQDAQAVWDAFGDYGVSDYVLLERGGVWYAVFGITGENSAEYAPMSGMVLHDIHATARRVVEEATAACLEENGAEPVVICLSHSGTDGNGRGEDYDLARAVDGIDLIISGHTHTTLAEPLQVGDTYIVSCGEYGKNLGSITLTLGADGALALDSYELIPIDGSVAEDPDTARWIEEAKGEVEENYLSAYGLTFDQVLADNPYVFDSVDQVYAAHHESTLGNLFSDAYKWAVEQATGEPVDLALTAAGVIRETIPQGEVTVSDVFNAASLGIGADGMPGYPLVAVYLTGADLKTVLEIDTSVSDLMGAARLYCSGVEYSYNTNRMLFNRVTDSALRRSGAAAEAIADGQLYRVVTGLYCGQMLGAVEDTSFGLLSVTARDANGDPIDMDRLEDYIVHDQNGSEVKEWYAIAAYLQSMGGEVDEAYGQTDGRKVVYASWNPVKLLRNPNRFTIIVLVVILVVIGLVVLVVLRLTGRLGRRRKGGQTRGYRGYRGRRWRPRR